jgi:hypothetical protein
MAFVYDKDKTKWIDASQANMWNIVNVGGQFVVQVQTKFLTHPLEMGTFVTIIDAQNFISNRTR